MNRAQELTLAWAIADAVTDTASPEIHTQACTTIGAGDVADAIRDLLAYCARTNTSLPAWLTRSVRQWIRGYAGSEDAEAMVRLVQAIPVRTGRIDATGSRDRHVERAPQ